MVEPAKDWEAILILHVFHQVVSLPISLHLVFLWVCDDDLAYGVIPIQREEVLFTFMMVGKDQGMEGVVFQEGGWFIHEVNVGVTHVLVFHYAQSLFCDGVAKEVLVCGEHMVHD